MLEASAGDALVSLLRPARGGRKRTNTTKKAASGAGHVGFAERDGQLQVLLLLEPQPRQPLLLLALTLPLSPLQLLALTSKLEQNNKH